jgi:hypothetical protein
MRAAAILAGGVAAAVAAGPVAARSHVKPAHRPDFTGLWSNASLTSMERDDAFKTLTITEAQAAAYEKAHRGKPPEAPPGEDDVGGGQSEWWETDVGLARVRGQIRTSWIVAPADGKRPMTPAAKAFSKARHERRKTDFDNPEGRDASERCVDDTGAGPPLDNGGYNDNFQIVQTGDLMVIRGEWMGAYRIVRIGDARHPPADVRLPGGDSIARWDGDTLVIETTNFLPRDVDAPSGDTRADMKVIERLSRASADTLTYGYSVTNPARFSQTWLAEMPLRATKGPIYEYACHEGNYGLVNMLAGARRQERTAAAAHGGER